MRGRSEVLARKNEPYQGRTCGTTVDDYCLSYLSKVRTAGTYYPLGKMHTAAARLIK